MPAQRYVKRTKLTSTKRDAVEASLYSKIDVALKELRSCSNQLNPLETGLQDELRILERLYYKGVNQHRSALFWRKVQEMRKFGRRLLEVQMRTLTDDLRYSFYLDEGLERNPKILRNAWSQLPDTKYVTCIFERMQSALILLDETRKRFSGAHKALTLMMQTGAFLQLILVLTAILSRMDLLTAEMRDLVAKEVDIVASFLEALGGKSPKVGGHKGNASPIPPEIATRNAVREDMTVDDIFDEDIGSVLPRRTSLEISKAIATEISMTSTPLWQQDTPRDPDVLELQPVYPNPDAAIITKTSEQSSSVVIITKKAKKSTCDEPLTTKKVKKKKKRDEIDDIFGSL